MYDSFVTIEGHTIKRCDHNRNGGGVAVYLNDSLLDKATVRDVIPSLPLELLSAENNLVRTVQLWFLPGTDLLVK